MQPEYHHVLRLGLFIALLYHEITVLISKHNGATHANAQSCRLSSVDIFREGSDR
jgi:hypothetical protein